MPHTLEPASSGRAKCRGCGQKIEKGEIRLGERQPNPFGDGEMTLWFHPTCAAFKRPEVFLEVLDTCDASGIDAETLRGFAEHSAGHRRRARINGAQKAPTGRARCRHCKEMIGKGLWRVPLAYFEDGRFQPSGFVHMTCVNDYFETTDVLDAIRHFSPELTDADFVAIKAELNA
ncbi:MAG: hypothetical protein AAF438_11540 [Pseudomonadota bacterium]